MTSWTGKQLHWLFSCFSFYLFCFQFACDLLCVHVQILGSIYVKRLM